MMQTTDDQRSKWYEQENSELAKPQRFPLTGDNLVSQRVIASGPFNGGEIGPELAAARYRDHQWDQERSSALQQTSSTNRDSIETRSVGAWQKLAGTQTDTTHNAESETQYQQIKSGRGLVAPR